MKKLLLSLAIVIVLVSACQGAAMTTPASPTATPVPPTDKLVPPTDTPVPPTDTPVPPTDTPLPPTDTPEPTVTPAPTPVPLTSAEELHGRWRWTHKQYVHRPSGHIFFEQDGSMVVQDGYGRLFWGEYWFEDGNLHVRTLGQDDERPECDPSVIGVYQVQLRHDGEMFFKTVRDECGGGQSRQWVLRLLKCTQVD